MPASFWFMVAVIGTAGITFVTIVIWVSERTKQRQAHYESENIRKLIESGGAEAATLFLAERQKARAIETRNGMRLGGIVTIAVGFALMVFFHQMFGGAPLYLVGLIPMAVGVALLAFTELVSRPGD